MFRGAALLQGLVLCACVVAAECRSYAEGNIVPAARRGQFHQVRNCPLDRESTKRVSDLTALPDLSRQERSGTTCWAGTVPA